MIGGTSQLLREYLPGDLQLGACHPQQQFARVFAGRDEGTGQHRHVPVGVGVQSLGHEAGQQQADLLAGGQRGSCHGGQRVQRDQLAVRLFQYRLIQSVAAFEVIVDQCHVHTGMGGHRLAGRAGQAMGGKQFTGRLQDAGTRGLTVGAGAAGRGAAPRRAPPGCRGGRAGGWCTGG